MKITVVESSDEQGKYKLSISIDNNNLFNVSDGEPEDATLCRDFSDCYKIPSMLSMAYNAGKHGDELILLKYTERD